MAMKLKTHDIDLKNDVVVDGRKYLLSTVDLLFSCYGSGRYETMLFAYDGEEVNYCDLYYERYMTKAEAVIGHNALLIRLEGGEKIWE